ncbi:MAG: hypothetical protein NDJ92_19005, partial [Thermoanaerobaculia bacterium]|nr:hypothetical protein [Thermoanaerobaculia bacterium]
LCSFVMVKAPAAQNRSFTGIRRVVGIAGLLAFGGAFFVIPLYAAITICGMPCCHHDQGRDADALVSSQVSGCEAECSLREASATSTITPSIVSPKLTDDQLPTAGDQLAAIVVSPPPAPIEHDRSPSAEGAHAPLHVLNSVFRI